MIITGLGMGGAEHVVVNLADTLVARGNKVTIAYLTGEALVLPRSSNVKVVSIGIEGPKDFFKAYIKLRALIKENKPDVIHSHMFHANLLARLLRLTIFYPKLICSSHSNNEGGKLRMLAYRLTEKLGDISTNVSQDAVDTLVSKGAVSAKRMVSIPNGVNLNEFFLNYDARIEKRKELNVDNKKMILAVGRFHKAKDYPNLLNSIALLKQKRQDFIVFIAGDGPLKEEIYSLVKKLNIYDYVKFLGIRKDVKSLLSATDLYVMSSAWEGLPMVILEAMACECFIVATDCGGVREAIGNSGVVLESGNHISLSTEIDKALDMTSGERSEVGAIARQRVVDGFSLESNVDAYFKLYLD